MILRTCLLALCAPFFASCSTAWEWREFRSGPATRGEVYGAIVHVARTDGFLPGPGCDRGLGIWESRWRERQLGMGRPGRFRLITEMELDDGSTEEGWTIIYRIEQQIVDDLRRSMNPQEDDWEDAGQDSEREELFARRLQMRISPETLVPGMDFGSGRPSGDPSGGGR